MSEQTAVEPTTTDELSAPESGSEQLAAEDLLVEEVSIDGMCGVY